MDSGVGKDGLLQDFIRAVCPVEERAIAWYKSLMDADRAENGLPELAENAATLNEIGDLLRGWGVRTWRDVFWLTCILPNEEQVFGPDEGRAMAVAIWEGWFACGMVKTMEPPHGPAENP